MRRSSMWIAAFAGCLVSSAALAQSWPTKRVQVIVPFTAGSATDIMARTITQRLSEQLGQPFVVENRAGAGGTLGVAAVAKADPDGHTILVHSSSYTITPTTYPNTPYDAVRDLVGITPLALLPQVLVVSPNKNIRTVQDLVRAAKAKPGAMNYASAGVGTATQLSAERFRLAAGIDAARDREPAAAGGREGARRQGGARKHGQARRRANADAPGGVRRLHSQRDH